MLPNPEQAEGALVARGWFHLQEGITPEEFDAFARGLGRILLETAVRLTREGRTYLSSPRPLPMHTDHPAVERIAWHCLRQDSGDGASLLVDTGPILVGMGELRGALTRVRLGCPPLEGLTPSATWPLAWHEEGRTLTYYAPWQRAAHEDDEAAQAYAEFRRRVEATVPTRVRLEEGEVLVIDNRRMLHGRGPLPPSSPRQLRRLWLAR